MGWLVKLISDIRSARAELDEFCTFVGFEGN